MLLELHIGGLGVIDDVSLEFGRGLTVLTGETGAGKTMVTVGLSLALGRRARAGLVRRGAARATVEARFDVRGVSGAGEWAEDDELILARAVTAEGRSTARVGGQLAPLSTLTDVGDLLVELHGQHQTQRLLRPPAQLRFVDRYCGAEHLELLEAYRRLSARLRQILGRLAGLEEESRQREREKDLLGHQAREIEAAGLRRGELAELYAEEARLAHAERIRARVAAALSALSEEGGGSDALRSASAAAAEVASIDPAAAELAGRMSSLAEEAIDAADALRAYADGVELDPARLAAVRDRLGAIRTLERKYGEGEEGVLAYLEQARARLGALEREVVEREGLITELERLDAHATELAGRLSSARSRAAPRLSEDLRREVAALGMEGASIDVSLTSGERLGPDGAEGAVMLFSGGPAQEPQALGEIASGGELSRTMLACRTVLADLDDVPTLVFDEVDVGIGGRAGVAVGRRLARLAQRRQVIVVTHLPQIASFADRHFRVTKDRGTAHVEALEETGRIEELSRMLSGLATHEAATHAEQLLAEAAREKA